ncbi:hypothetical protein AB0420_07450 [Streptomyces caelestis]|uniref:hypothetical protein n=1 Tax=Streptomyces TaxID=1883 RepID=UPI0006B043BA|nr:hypothetical protein [Streptomyces sp. XY152]KOV34682.1 hypothetical protein ADK58_04670 [Streptomyces sp. XY152]
MRRAFAVASLAALILPLTATTASAAEAGEIGTLVIRKSFACSSPKGENINFSWTEGIQSTTIYYNNHCSTSVKVTIAKGSGETCWTVPKGKDKEVFGAGTTVVRKGC